MNPKGRQKRPSMLFDPHLCSPARMAIMAAVADGNALSFSVLRDSSGLADGNLHVQTRKLAAAGYLEILRSREGRRAVTRFQVTQQGRRALELHFQKLGTVLRTGIAVQARERPGRWVIARRCPDPSQVWAR